MAILLSRETAPGDLFYPERIMPGRQLSPEEMDWFCRNVLPELAVYRNAVMSGSRNKVSEGFVKTPQAIGQSLRRIEEDLAKWLNGGTLLDHSRKKSVHTTEAGDLLLEFATAILAQSEAFLDKLHGLQSSGEVRLACIHSGWMAYGPKLTAAFAKKVPGGTITAHTIGGIGYPEKIAAEVREGRVDIGITSYPPKVAPPLVCQLLQERRMLLVFSAKYAKLPREKGPLKVDRIISRDDKLRVAVHARSADSPLGNQVVYYLNKRDAYLGHSQLFEVANIAEIKATIEQFPETISILPEDAVAEEVAKGKFRAYALDPPLKPWTWGLIYRVGTSRAPVLQFIECLRPLFAKKPHKQLRGS